MAKSSRTARLIVREKMVHQVISDYNHEAVIAEYIRTKGVTRCPTACVVPTQASVNKADRAALEEYAVERDRQRWCSSSTSAGRHYGEGGVDG